MIRLSFLYRLLIPAAYIISGTAVSARDTVILKII